MIGEARPSPEAYSPVEDPNVPPSEVAERFMAWISSYFEPLDTLQDITPTALAQREDVFALTADAKFSCTTSRMTNEELQAATYPAIFACNPTPPPTAAILQVYRDNYRRAILDTKGAWPNVDVTVLWGEMSPFYFLWAAKVMSQHLKEPVRIGEQRRNMRIVKMEKANHFVCHPFTSGIMLIRTL